ncbi:MAG: fumarate hydratase, partial [Spirochaetia bacterium]|nr:fumarate hydratase [Spirochaetia bacterium]
MNQKIYSELVSSIQNALILASTQLEKPLLQALVSMKDSYSEALKRSEKESKESKQLEASLLVLTMILKNLDISSSKQTPMCQDTGMLIAFADIGPKASFSMLDVEKAVTEGATKAIEEGHFRYSIVEEPLFVRKNTLNNLPFVIHYGTQKEGALSLHFLLKGFGSENCSATKMLNPTSTAKDVIGVILQMVKEAGGKPCPPIVVGVGLGGSSEMSAILAKRALLRDVGSYHAEPKYREFEKELLLELQTTNIGPGGFGGPLTALWASVEYMGTHIAGLPVSVAISCWA